MKFRSKRIWPLLKENNKWFWENNFFNWVKYCLDSSWIVEELGFNGKILENWVLYPISMNFIQNASNDLPRNSERLLIEWTFSSYHSFHWWPSPINSKIFQNASRPSFPLEFHSELHSFFHSIVKLVYSASSNCEALIGTHCS